MADQSAAVPGAHAPPGAHVPRRAGSAERAADMLPLVVEDWLRLRSIDGCPPPGEAVRSVAVLAALAAPVTASRCPRLLHLAGPSVAARVSAQAAVSAVSGLAAAAAPDDADDRPLWVSTAEAARALGLTAGGVRDRLRRGTLRGQRHETGWRVDAADLALAVRRRLCQPHGRRNGLSNPG